MSDYRDDSHSIAVASDHSWLGLKSIVEDSVKATATVIFGLTVLHSGTAVASDHIEDKPGISNFDSAKVSDEVFDSLEAVQFVSSKARASDRVVDKTHTFLSAEALVQDFVFDKVTAFTFDSASVSDEVISLSYSSSIIDDFAKASDKVIASRRVDSLTEDSALAIDEVFSRTIGLSLIYEEALASDEIEGLRRVRSVSSDSAKASDYVAGQRYTDQEVVDTAKAKDSLAFKLLEQLSDSATATDKVTSTAKAFNLVEDYAQASDYTTGVTSSEGLEPVTDTATASSEVWDHLHAFNLITEIIVAEDEALSTDGSMGQAWTANADNWAMSRYAPYTFHRLVVIDGLAYGITDDGVYQLSEGVESIKGEITTGKLDLGGGALVHPVSAYLEYELEGTAEMEVSTTQSGIEQRFTYPLAPEVANELTNGRFIFGRGLRGRHFSFKLKVEGVEAYINDLSVHSTETRRRV